jgi:hypothetical protein
MSDELDDSSSAHENNRVAPRSRSSSSPSRSTLAPGMIVPVVLKLVEDFSALDLQNIENPDCNRERGPEVRIRSMIPMNRSNFGLVGGLLRRSRRRYREASIFATVRGSIPNRRAAKGRGN